MEQWSREMRYRKYEEVDEKEMLALQEKVKSSPYRQFFHIQPPTGLLSHPSGLIFFNGQYYIAHQWFPLGPVDGLKYWRQLTSDNLVTFKDKGMILRPDQTYDRHGVHSGSAFSFQSSLYYMYTANHRDENWALKSSQVIAKVQDDGTVQKLSPPAISTPPEGYTQQFSDPKVFEKGEQLHAVIGAQREDLTGCLLMYVANQPEGPWHFKGEIKTQLQNFGHMWTSPDYFQIHGKDILLFCPEGVESDQYQNTHLSGYIVGTLDFETLVFEHGEFQELDAGFDFYAPQTMEDEAGRRVLIGWMGLPDVDYPTDDDGWAHCLTLPRTLTIENQVLKQKPHMHLRKLRSNEESALGYANKFIKQLHPYEGVQYELVVDILENESSAFELQLRASSHESTVIRYETATKEVVLERFDSGALPFPVEGTSRSTRLNSELKQLRIFVDTSSIEIFCNEGERVLTSRIFPKTTSNKIKVVTDSGQVYLKMTKYDIATEMTEE
ncbi:sucrose-6-phosphate hydrolase [Staphylococcus coagulans]|uniref:sucrose-6-phosphate hydrolase n=1 Tax=Staphylococcus coagulans TaxID=74706 RepID=UPI0015FCC3D4|nr:sucrose-6-phosphate hydrolase [Staphylococcus coagulans]MBA8765014.1 sucrose-6-phosphate hydrolase [Staphylococcus coagulans]MBT2810595.1 sucrose-6-phosphate hydrolase [Staphylococcus coagulans]MBT2812693.1 sucrose-6-phosphate hydrolase [Staphylococcus coagulans]MBT2819529.1 sucrose-6-phosphate hydrolase [Staphylococcus coagulans]MBT2822029.1 sucrose-6-phosphate hydrolase [Staphylococcus coagulans]